MSKKTSIIAASLLLTGFLIYAIGWYIVPNVQYSNAVKSLESQSFDEAYEAFVALGDYNDSPAKAIDTLYQKGIYLMNIGSYLDAATEFERISDYLDSSDQAVFCRNQATYLNAMELLEAGNYNTAQIAWINKHVKRIDNVIERIPHTVECNYEAEARLQLTWTIQADMKQ